MTRLLTPREVAAHLSVSPEKVYRMLQKGEMRPVRLGRAVRVTEGEVEKFVRESMEAADGA